jgi:hypothetical protein
MRCHSLLIPVVLSLTAETLAAQRSTPDTARTDTLRASLSGTVRDSLGLPVAGVAILLAPGAVILRTDSAGVFVSRRVAVGRVNLSLRRLGFAPADTQALIHIGKENVVDVVMRRLPQVLAGVTIEADRQCRRFSLDGLLCRREQGRGHFIGYEEILAKKPIFLADILRDTPGFRIDVTPRGPIARSVVEWRCIKTLVDGDEVKRTNPTPLPKDVFAVEIFQRGEVPPEYRHWPWRGTYPCTLLVYWTKRVLGKGLSP